MTSRPPRSFQGKTPGTRVYAGTLVPASSPVLGMRGETSAENFNTTYDRPTKQYNGFPGDYMHEILPRGRSSDVSRVKQRVPGYPGPECSSTVGLPNRRVLSCGSGQVGHRTRDTGVSIAGKGTRLLFIIQAVALLVGCVVYSKLPIHALVVPVTTIGGASININSTHWCPGFWYGG